MSYQVIGGCPSTSGDDYPLNLISILKNAYKTFPEVEIVSRKDDGSIFRYNYQKAYERITKLARALKKLGIKPGDRVGVVEWNTHRFFELYFGISCIGAVVLQMNLRLSSDDLAYVVDHSGAKLIVVGESLIPVVEALTGRVKTVAGYVVITDKDLDAVETDLKPIFSYEELLDKEEAPYDWPMIDERSAYSACYTTGTTGKPKGVYYSHRCIYLHTMASSMSLEFSLRDVIMQTAPMFHAAGWGTWLCAPMVGAKLVLPGKYTMEDPKTLVDLLVNEKVTFNNGAPAIFLPMLEYIRTLPQKPEFGNLRMVSGATEPPLSMMQGYAELGVNIVHGYGATETGPLTLLNQLKPTLKGWSRLLQWENQKKQGIPVTGVDVNVVDGDGKEVPHDGQTIGELYIRGPWIASSYYNDPRSEECFTDGYWKSGDAATIDENGYIKITDRFKDIIKSGGEWISSIDLENAIIAHPQVLESAVIGLAHPKWQERPLALVVLKQGAAEKITQADILAFIENRFAKWQLPDEVLFVDEIAKTSVGKLDKKTLRNQYQNLYTKR